MRAIVLIKMNSGDLQDVWYDLKRLRQVVEAHITSGPYDLLAIIQAAEISELGRIVANQIQLLPGVVSTCTCLMVEGELLEEIQVIAAPIEQDQPYATGWPYNRGVRRPFGYN